MCRVRINELAVRGSAVSNGAPFKAKMAKFACFQAKSPELGICGVRFSGVVPKDTSRPISL